MNREKTAIGRPREGITWGSARGRQGREKREPGVLFRIRAGPRPFGDERLKQGELVFATGACSGRV
ncbi:hypothetical protein B4135_2872 [Caldibacillus debilis]|uniref:Uncharacterized protein n=1 Tax=Caldibacillus debilis TaxID=301148 RepID=A0A150LQ86_9BACI|nr:hypothetical protein B4135_2872 [Caldibacillus debilis]